MMRSLKPFLVAILAVGVLAGPADAVTSTPSRIHSLTVRDAGHDLLRARLDAVDPPLRPAPRRREGDIISMGVVHGAHQVRVTVHYLALTRKRGLSITHVLAIRTRAGGRADLSVHASAGSWTGGADWRWRADGHTTFSCAGLTNRISYRRDTLRVVVPTRCLGNPRWVRVGAGVGAVVGSTIYIDDASLAGRWRNDVAFGPRLYRGRAG